jgi:hypothetical protein
VPVTDSCGLRPSFALLIQGKHLLCRSPVARISNGVSFVLHACRRLFPPSQTSAELNARFATMGFGWLVGEMELQRGDIQVRR